MTGRITVAATAILLCFYAGNVSCYVDTNGLTDGGSNVCSRATSRTVQYQTRASRHTYRRSTTKCGWFGWSRCTQYHQQTAYYLTNAHRTQYGRELFCCSGWQRTGSECRTATCDSGCLHGSCTAPNRCTCNSGWTSPTCNLDIPECVVNNGNCQQVCTNFDGGYRCSCRRGYRLITASDCNDINECRRNLNLCQCKGYDISQGCNATCVNTHGSYRCSCSRGFQLLGKNVCTDKDECAFNNGGCNQECHNTPGSYYCSCRTGYKLGRDRKTCVDVDECQSFNGHCDHICDNLPGSYLCNCRHGFTLDSNRRTCSARDLCQHYHGCAHICNNFHGSYSCSCRQGYKLKSNNRSCTDIDECSPVRVQGTNLTASPAGCDQNCGNSIGSFSCSCNSGFVLHSDGKRCRDVDECESAGHGCDQVCHNTIGSYTCSCYMGYMLTQDKKNCQGLPCEYVEAPPNGKMSCSGQTTNKTCSFTCDPGFNQIGASNRTCLPSSKWSGEMFSCKAMTCQQLAPPINTLVPMSCMEEMTYGSSCQINCSPGYYGNGDGRVTCNVTQGLAGVSWNMGNFSCQELTLCSPNPCLHNGPCSAISNSQFVCDCSGTGYQGERCQIGIISTPEFPKVKAGVLSKILSVSARPTKDLRIVMKTNEKLLFEPSKILGINNVKNEANFTILGTIPGVYSVSYVVEGTNKNDFETPNDQELYVGLQEYQNETIFCSLSLTYGELPQGKYWYEEKNSFSCKIEFSSTTPWENKHQIGTLTKGVVHAKSTKNTFPLSLTGVELKHLAPSQGKMLNKLISKTNIPGSKLLELLQNDSFAISVIQHFSELLPCWLSVLGHKNDMAFSVYNTFGTVYSLPDSPVDCMCSELPFLSNTTTAFYCPQVVTEMSIEQDKGLLSTQSIACMGIDLCHSTLFIIFSRSGSTSLENMQLLQRMKQTGWTFEIQALGFSSDESLHNHIQGLFWDGLQIKSLVSFHPDVWLRGSVHVVASSAAGDGFKFSMRIDGETVIGVKNVEEIFVTGLESTLTASIKAKKAEFNISFEALGQQTNLQFSSNNLVGRAKLGGKQYDQGLFFSLDERVNPWKNSPLARIIKPSENSPIYFSVFYTITGRKQIGLEAVSAHTLQREFGLLKDFILPQFNNTLEDIGKTVPAVTTKLKRWFQFVKDFSASVSKAIQELKEGTNSGNVLLLNSKRLLALQCLKKDLESKLLFAKNMAIILESQLSYYPATNSLANLIIRIQRFSHLLPKSISLNSIVSLIQKQLKGFAFLMTNDYCISRLCFGKVNTTIEYGQQLRQKVTKLAAPQSISVDEISILVQGTVMRTTRLGQVLNISEGGNITALLKRNDNQAVTLFKGNIDLLGLKQEVIINVTSGVLSFKTTGRIFKNFLSEIDVKSPTDVWNWDSLIYQVNGKMNTTSQICQLLEENVFSYTKKVVSETLESLNISEDAAIKARSRRQEMENILLLHQKKLQKARDNRKQAKHEYRSTRQSYNWAKEKFENQFGIYNDSCQLMQCNYICDVTVTCLVEVSQKILNTTISTRDCEVQETVVYEESIEQEYRKSSYSVQTWGTRCEPRCNKVISTIGKIVGGLVGLACGIPAAKAGNVMGFVKASFPCIKKGVEVGGNLFLDIFGGCSTKCSSVRGPNKNIEFVEVENRLVKKPRNVYEYKCSEYKMTTLTTKGYSAELVEECKPINCFRILDPKCIAANQKCKRDQRELSEQLRVRNEIVSRNFQTMKYWEENLDVKALALKSTEIKEDAAQQQFNFTKTIFSQMQSAEKLANASLFKARSFNIEGLELASHLDKNSGEKLITVESIDFNLLTSTGTNTRFPVRVSAVSYTGFRKTIEVVIDFKKLTRSISIAVKKLVGPLLSKSKPLREKRSIFTSPSNTNVTLSNYDYDDCSFVTKANAYFEDVVQSLSDVIRRRNKIQAHLTADSLAFDVMINKSVSSNDTLNNFTLTINQSNALQSYIELLQDLKRLHQQQSNGMPWNETVMSWRGFLEVLTDAKGFYSCSGTANCINYFINAMMDLYEYEDDIPRGSEIKQLIPELKQQLFGLIQDNFTAVEGIGKIAHLVNLLNKTNDKSVKCGQKPQILQSSPLNVAVVKGDNLTLICKGHSDTPSTIKWKKNRIDIPKENNTFLILIKLNKSDEAAYVCEMENRKGSVVSNVSIVRVEEKPYITKHPENVQFIQGSNQPIMFTCNATGIPRPTFQWYVTHKNATKPKKLINNTEPFLYKTLSTPYEEGLYFCEASNVHGTVVSKKAHFDVLSTTAAVPAVAATLNITFPPNCDKTANSSINHSVNARCLKQNITLPEKLNENLKEGIKRALLQSVGASSAIMRNIYYEYYSPSVAALSFILGTNKPFLEIPNNSSFEIIAKRIDKIRRKLLEKVDGLHRDTVNSSFVVAWNNVTLVSVPESFQALLLPPQCKHGQELHENWIVCVSCPPGEFAKDNAPCVKCPRGTYQPSQGQRECFSCAENHTTLQVGSTDVSHCVLKVKCSAGSYNVGNETCTKCPRGTYQQRPGQSVCYKCPGNYSTRQEGSVKKENCIPQEKPTTGSITLPVEQSTTSMTSGRNDKPTPTLRLSEKPVSVEKIKIYCVAEGDGAVSRKEWSTLTDALLRELAKNTGVSSLTSQSIKMKVTGRGLEVMMLLPKHVKDKLVFQQTRKKLEFFVNGTIFKCSSDESGILGIKNRTSKTKQDSPWVTPLIVTLIIIVIVVVAGAVVCYRRQQRTVLPKPQQRANQYMNEAFEATLDEPKVPPELKDIPASSTNGCQQYFNEAYGLPPCNDQSVPPEHMLKPSTAPVARQWFYNITYDDIPFTKSSSKQMPGGVCKQPRLSADTRNSEV